jgi:uncharacterized protein YjiS (DUF1127 family)
LAEINFEARPKWRATSPQSLSSAVQGSHAGRSERAFTPGGRAARLRIILGRALTRLVESVISWNQCRRDRQLLASLDERTLRDIGIDRAAVKDDCTTSFWRLR